ncbi:MAG: NADH-quinone oxidoreductase subunit C [Bilifractor sp.]
MTVRKSTMDIREIPKDRLLAEVMQMKKNGYRLSQIGNTWINGRYEVYYSFADDHTLDYHTLKLVVDRNEELPSITEIIPAAVYYENEISEMFGVHINMISNDYHGKFYRIQEKTPMLPKEDK